jgi:uncharacterized protein YjiS (DUF1127 family)
MLLHQKHLYCIDTISADLVASPYTGKSVMALWQEVIKATTIWLAMTLFAAAQIFFIFLERNSQRKALGALDDRLLKDIDISRAAATREADKPFWRK